MTNDRRRDPGCILRRAYPVAKYIGVLWVSLNLLRLPDPVWLAPGFTGPRFLLMLWTVLLLTLSWRADIAADRALAKGTADHLSFIAVATLGLFLLDALCVAHLYLCQYNSAGLSLELPARLPSIVMATGCVLWIYGRVAHKLPFGSAWGLRTKRSLESAESWALIHENASRVCLAVGAACLIIGTFIPG